MKKISRLLVLLSMTSGIALLSAVPAQGQQGRFYVRGDLGGNLTQDTDLKEFFGPVAPGSKIKFDPGVRFGVAAGFHVTDWFSAEGETGILANSIDSITGASRVDATFSNVPFLVNARFQCPRPCRLTPYVGGGLGVSAAILDADRITLGGTSIRGSDSDGVFAYQGFAGLRCKLNYNMGLSLEYRYFGADSPRWEGDFRLGNIHFGRTETHSLSIAFDYSF